MDSGSYWGSKGGAVVRALASHQCGPGSNPGVNTICGLSLLLVLSLAPRGFFFGYSGFPLSSNTNSSKFQFDLERILSAPCLNKLLLQKGKIRRSTVQTKYMPHVSDEVGTQDECLKMHELVIFTLHFTKRQKTDVID